MRSIALGSVLAGIALLISCGGLEPAPAPDPTPAPVETVMYARAAVEVGTIDISEMAEFEVSVQRMDLAQRSEIWQKLKVLHENVHPSGAAAARADTSSVKEGGGGGCSPARCSHSAGCTAAWCCAFGEDAVFYDAGGCPVDLTALTEGPQQPD
jgi:hypothetical protein